MTYQFALDGLTFDLPTSTRNLAQWRFSGKTRYNLNMSEASNRSNERGSQWNRWEPHIHTPGTVLNDQYEGSEAWDDFLTRLEQAEPNVRAVGITDYFSIDRYEETLAHKAAGRLLGINLIFPNVELRLSIETSKSSPINLHLLFDPSADNHIDEIRNFLLEFEFSYLDYPYRCSREGLIKLGKAHNPSIRDDDAAATEGANQFKVNFQQLKTAWKKNPWVRANALIAVAGGEKDGTSGLRDPKGSFDAFRKEIEGFAHIIFSGNPAIVRFWAGKGPRTVEQLEREYSGRKPCLHGSDAHSGDKVALPDLDRRCWIKGDLTFESLRQACIEPEDRVFIGAEPPVGALRGRSIKSISVSDAPWLTNPTVDLNPGLVAIIGARGSGKTALADLIAAGGLALESHINDKSFVRRAQAHLRDCVARLTWGSDETTTNSLTDTDWDNIGLEPEVQYLSQQFVDQLCSSEGLDDALILEIERVIFNSHPITDRLGATSFQELLSLRLRKSRLNRERQQEALTKALDELASERAKKAGLPALEKELREKRLAIQQDQKDRKSLVPKGDEERATRCEQIAEAVNLRRQVLDSAKLTVQSLLDLKEDVSDFRDRRGPALLSEWKDDFRDARLSTTDWAAFELAFNGDVDSILTKRIEEARKAVSLIEGPSDTDPPLHVERDPKIALITPEADLQKETLYLLESELSRLTKLVTVDDTNRRRLTALTEKITKAETAVMKLVKEIESLKGADERIETHLEARQKAYGGVFEAIVDQERELGELYSPIKSRLEQEQGSLSKLSFSVRREVDLASWAAQGEALLDLRSGPFKGRGELFKAAQRELLPAWQSGSAAEAAATLVQFVKTHEEDLRKHKPEAAPARQWAKDVGAWLYGTNHIHVGYGLQYEGTEIEQLSPGTRGIVLLLLYLAIDAEDDRPLLIDQPEENLDPQSIFRELVHRFRDAKRRRQIIIVTHNANLVVNTDADQVIVASCGPHRPGALPLITYRSGGLEDPAIRKSVCEILEGGERAFKERARRLRVEFS